MPTIASALTLETGIVSSATIPTPLHFTKPLLARHEYAPNLINKTTTAIRAVKATMFHMLLINDCAFETDVFVCQHTNT